VVVADQQTAGRGRQGHSFWSPKSLGLYFSLLIRPKSTELISRMTPAAAVAAVQAIEETAHITPGIKWVNDLFLGGKKVCGILTEASINFETGVPDWVILGIGFNVYLPEGGFPPELKDIAGAITETRSQNLRSRITAEFLKSFHRICSDLNNSEYSEEYKRRSLLLGQRIDVLKSDCPVPATAIDIDEECRLIVRYDDQSTEVLSSGEVSVRPSRG
jgi:BirA family biotin operon repressor/biotin-[acetyl-CoA-carboxylase] ligase